MGMNSIKVNLNLTEFVKTGAFGFIKLGESKQEIISQFFPPEDWSNENDRNSSQIWRYGNFEFHFYSAEEESILKGIFNDYIPEINGGESLDIIDWWIFENGNYAPTLLEVIKELNTMGINFNKRIEDAVGAISINLENGVFMTFHSPDELISSKKSNINVNEYPMSVLGKRIKE